MAQHRTLIGTSTQRHLRHAIGAAACAAIVAVAVPGTASAQTYVDPSPQDPSLNVDGFAPVCVRTAPFIQYSIVPVGFTPTSQSATLRIMDKDRQPVETVQVDELSGMILFPGAAVDGAGNAIDWPGWKQTADGSWVHDPDTVGLREGLNIEVQLDGHTAETFVTYPAATEPCAGPSAGFVGSGSGVRTQGALPSTGSSASTTMLTIGAAAVLAGGIALTIRRQAPRSQPITHAD